MPDAEASSSAPLVLGAGMTTRTRPRLGTSHRHQRRGAIGLVARSTIGFGRIVASAGSARPTVTVDALTSKALRPPLGAWTGWRADEPEPAFEPTWTTQAAPGRRDIQRKAAAQQAAPRQAPAPRPAPQTKKLDSLRRLLEQRGMIDPVAAADVVPEARPESASPAAAASVVARSAELGDRTATSAGPTTAPGQLARRSRPEPTSGQERLSVVFPEGTPTSRSASAARAAGGAGGMDRFRDALAAKGLIEPNADDSPRSTSSSGRSSGRPEAPRKSDRAARSTNERRPIQRSSDPAAPSSSNSPANSPANSPSGDRGDDAPSARSFADDIAHLTAPLPLSLLPERNLSAQRAPLIDTARREPVVGIDWQPDGPATDGGSLDTMSPPIGVRLHDAPSAAAHNTLPASPARQGPAPSQTVQRSAAPVQAAGVVAQPPAGIAPASTVEVAQHSISRAHSDVTNSAPAEGRQSPHTRQRLREVGRRLGIPHTRSLVNRPATELTTRLQRATIEATSRLTATTALGTIQPARGAGVTDSAIAAAGPTSAPERSPARSSDVRRTELRRSDADVTSERTMPSASIPATRRPSPGAGMPDSADIPLPLLRRPGSVIADLRRSFDPALASVDVFGTPRITPISGAPGALQRALSALAGETPSPSLARSTDPATAASAITTRRRVVTDVATRPTARRQATFETGRADAGTHERASVDSGAAPDRLVPSPPPAAPKHPDLAARLQRTPESVAPVTTATATVPAPPTTERAARTPRQVDERTPATSPGPDIARLSTVPPQSALAERFLQELGREPAAAGRKLPQPFQPLASAITGAASRVRISTDAVTRRALQAVGKKAATIGDTIHLQRAPDHDMRFSEVIAHELTHVAHPSPVPRFFDDDHRGPEERMAEQVAKVIARAPVMRSSSAPSSRVGSSAPDTIRRSPAAPAPATSGSSSPGTVSAADLAASISGGSGGASGSQGSSSSTSGGVIRRSSSTGVQAARLADPSPTIRRVQDGLPDELPAASGTGSPFGNEREEREWFERMVSKSIEEIVRRVEDRVIIDLERRGGRNWRNL